MLVATNQLGSVGVVTAKPMNAHGAPERGLRNLRNSLVDARRLIGWCALRVSCAAGERGE